MDQSVEQSSPIDSHTLSTPTSDELPWDFVDDIPCLSTHQYLLTQFSFVDPPPRVSARLFELHVSMIDTYKRYLETLRGNASQISTHSTISEALEILGTSLCKSLSLPRRLRVHGVLRLMDRSARCITMEDANEEVLEWWKESRTTQEKMQAFMPVEGMHIASTPPVVEYILEQIKNSQRYVTFFVQDVLDDGAAAFQDYETQMRILKMQTTERKQQAANTERGLKPSTSEPKQRAAQELEDSSSDMSGIDTPTETSSDDDDYDYGSKPQSPSCHITAKDYLETQPSKIARQSRQQRLNRGQEHGNMTQHMNVFSARSEHSSKTDAMLRHSCLPSNALSETAERVPIRGIRGGYLSPNNSDSEGHHDQNQDQEDEESDEKSSSSEEEYEGDDLDAAAVQEATKIPHNPNNPLVSDEPLVFQQRSKYFQTHQERREVESKSRRASISGGMALLETNESIGTGGLFGSGALFESEKAATSVDSLGATKRKREDEHQSAGDKGKQGKEVAEEAPLHDDIDDYERELRELDERNRKRMMRLKNS